MTITLEYTPHAFDVLSAAGLDFKTVDPKRALEDERERGKKYRLGSPKYAKHLERMARLEEECTNSARMPILSTGITSTSVEIMTNCGSKFNDIVMTKSPSSPPTSDREDAVLIVMALQGCTRDAAEKAVKRSSGDDAQAIALNARRNL